MGLLFVPFTIIAVPLHYLFNGDFETFSEITDFMFTEFWPMFFGNFFDILF